MVCDRTVVLQPPLLLKERVNFDYLISVLMEFHSDSSEASISVAYLSHNLCALGSFIIETGKTQLSAWMGTLLRILDKLLMPSEH